MPAAAAYRFLLDGEALGRWALGSFATRRIAADLYEGRSLFDGRRLLVRPVGDAARLLVDYHVGASRRSLKPRIMARVVPGEALGRPKRRCMVSLIAWRDAAHDDARWQRLVACHEVEVLLIQALLERRG